MLHHRSSFLKKPTQSQSDHKASTKAVTVESTGLSVAVTVGLFPIHLTALTEQPGWLWWWHCPPQLCPQPLQSPPQWRKGHVLALHAQESEEDDLIFLDCPKLLWVTSTSPAGSSVAGDLCRGGGECLTAMATAPVVSRPKIMVIIFFLWHCAEEELSAVPVQVWTPSTNCSRRESDAESDIWTSWKTEESDQKYPSLA